MLSSSPNINDTFFQGLYKHAWKGIIPPGLTEAEVDFIQEIALLNDADKEVIDFMCGYGRHTLELARRGIKVTAIDNLADYIEEVKIKAEEELLPVSTIHASILDVTLKTNFDAAICMGNSFAFFNKQDALSILKNISKHLKPAGKLLINSWMIAEIAIRHFKDKEWHYAGEYKCLLESEYLFFPSRIETEQTIIAPNGSIEKVKGIDYIFTLNEIELMFNEAGLKTKNLYSTPRKKKFSLGDGRIYLVAEKIA